ncbi:hypothetical protein L207DRAFT_2669 [Hyaloscypha variabilis F]|jgi:hypothetical protein|uniref:Uncharacterized protein n=1 Tax=Hyaloscypha variabilis (strain UAMH 11265 / GT02V1 / F) TaxID=1149755 RepID=A0A2J6SBS4_HYAVF|nr:hypothetical protein L207DRAFT_2669 [Hyaloscypha variabilis F]
MALLELVFMVLGFGFVAVVQMIRNALMQKLSDVIEAWIGAKLAAVPDTLAAMLWVEIAEYVDFLTWARDSVIQYWHQHSLRIGLGCGCWLLLTLHRRPRFWALLPFRYIWHIFLFLHFSVWSRSVRCPVDKELGPLLPNSILFPAEIEIPEDSLAHIDEGPVEDTEEMEPPKRVYKGPIVKSVRSKNGLVSSVPIMRSK